jgi:hypothetical protein
MRYATFIAKLDTIIGRVDIVIVPKIRTPCNGSDLVCDGVKGT